MMRAARLLFYGRQKRAARISEAPISVFVVIGRGDEGLTNALVGLDGNGVFALVYWPKATVTSKPEVAAVVWQSDSAAFLFLCVRVRETFHRDSGLRDKW
jgi:hypothetical protein